MTENRSQVIRRQFDALNRRDMEDAVEPFHAEIEWHPAREDPDARTHYGPAGLTRFWNQWIDSFDDIAVEAEEIVEEGDAVLVCNHYTGHGTASGALVDDRVYQVYRFLAGKILRVDEFYDREEALATLRASNPAAGPG